MELRLAYLSPELSEEFYRRRALRGARVYRLLSYAGTLLMGSYSVLEYFLDAPNWASNLVLRMLGAVVLTWHIHRLPKNPCDLQLDLHVCRHILLVGAVVCGVLLRMPTGFSVGMPGLTQLLLLGSLIIVRSGRVPWLLSTVALIGVAMWFDGGTFKLITTHLISLMLGLGMAWIVSTLQEAASRREFLLEKRLEFEATTDGLTGLLNRRALTRYAEDEVDRSSRYGHGLSVLLLDIDHFKSVNDTHGHDVGDLALRSIATLCAGAIRSTDRLARWGGEEFLILLPETGAENAFVLAERLRARIESHAVDMDKGQLRLTVSIGLSQRSQGKDWDVIVKKADEALYRAKEGGRNRVLVAPVS